MENKTLLVHVHEYIAENNTLKLPFYRIYDAVKSTVSACGLDGNKPDYAWIELIKVVSFTMNALAEMNIEYKIPEFEKETDDEEVELNYFNAYDELIDVYNELYQKRLFDTMEILFEQEVELANKKYLQLGMVEGQMFTMITKATEILDNVNNITKDEKKLIKFITTIDKKAPNISGIVKQLTDGLPKFVEMISRSTNKEQKE